MDKIFIGVREFAENLGVSDKTIYRMINDNQLPFAVKIGGQWRFRAESVARWLSARTSEAGQAKSIVNYQITVSEAVTNGSVLYRIHGSNRDETLDELLSVLPRTGDLNLRNCKFSILDREALVPSSLAGIACMAPSVEHPVFMERSLIIVAFLEEPTDFKALDSLPTRVIFLVLPANNQEEALLLTRLRRLFMEPRFVARIMASPPRKELMTLILGAEERLLPGRPARLDGKSGSAGKTVRAAAVAGTPGQKATTTG